MRDGVVMAVDKIGDAALIHELRRMVRRLFPRAPAGYVQRPMDGISKGQAHQARTGRRRAHAGGLAYCLQRAERSPPSLAAFAGHVLEFGLSGGEGWCVPAVCVFAPPGYPQYPHWGQA